MKLSILPKLFLSHFVAILLVSGSVGTYFYQSAVDSLMAALKSRLQNSAALISQGLQIHNLDQFRSAADVDAPIYQEYVRTLREFVAANPDITFVYIMRKQGDEVQFVLDSDPNDPALPGEVYPQRIPSLLEGFTRPSVDDEITHDRWGYFLSGYSPLGASTGEYLIGIDMRADEVQQKFMQIRMAGLLSLASSLLLAVLFSSLLSKSFTGRIRNLAQRFYAMTPIPGEAEPKAPGDELDQLSESFDAMAQQLLAHQREIEANQESLRKAREDLELRVEERTVELLQVNTQLRDEIAERKRIEQVLNDSSLTDYLTNVLNRRAITRHLEDLVAQYRRSPGDFCVVLVDVDHFKRVNDDYGHDIGDKALIRVAERLRLGIRPGDTLGRWGGEEFLIVVDDAHLEEARALAERLCRQLASTPFELSVEMLTITGSFGVSEYRSGENFGECLKRADDALYRAKSQGRNQVVTG